MVSAFSIGTSKRGDLNQGLSKGVPGPGAYNPDKKQKKIPPSWKIGSQERNAFKSNNNPGPGSYAIKNRIGESAKYSISLKNPLKGDQERVPGPGAYNPKQTIASNVKSTPNYSMGIKTNNGILSNTSKVPGPGAYERKSTVLNRPSSKFGTGQRTNLTQTEKTPGPGSYIKDRPSSALTKYADSRYQDGPQFGFGSQVRQSMGLNSKNPGPGSYQLKSSIDTNKGVTMISRRQQQDQLYASKIPGPGAYNPVKKQKIIPPSYKIGSGHRTDMSKSQLVPGPGTYSVNFINRPKSPNYKIGTDVRRPLSGNNNTPGVGTYSFPKKTQGPSYSMKGNVTADPIDIERQKIPGAGAYSPSLQQTKQRPQSAKFGTSSRPGLRNQDWVPGPGIYDVKPIKDGPKWGIGTGSRTQFKGNNVPGVGSYNLKPYFADVPSYLLSNTQRR